MAEQPANKSPVEDTCIEFLEDFSEDGAMARPSSSQPFQMQSPILDEHTQQLEERIRKLEKVETITQEEIATLRTRTETLGEEIQEVKESFASAKRRQEEAEAAAVDMKQKRDKANSEKTVMQNRIDQLKVAQRKDEQNRASIEASYNKKIVELQGVCNTQNGRLALLEQRLRELEEENYQLKKNSDFLKETLFVNSRPGEDSDRQQLRCFSCKQAYSADVFVENECQFHPLPRLPPNLWHRWRPGPGETFRKTRYAGYSYWPCCNTLSMRRPDGCCKGQHHQKWEMDVVMKRVMLSQETLEEMSRMEDTRII